MSIERSATLNTTAASTNHGADGPIDSQAMPLMKNAAAPNSTSARAVARQTDTYDTSVPEASTTRMRADGENGGMCDTRSAQGTT